MTTAKIARSGLGALPLSREQLLQGSVLLVGALLLAVAFRDMLTFEPYRPANLRAEAFEGIVFSPQGGGFAIFQAVATWMLWRRRHPLAGADATGLHAAGLPLLGLALVLFTWASYVDVAVLLFYVVPLLLLGLGWTLSGPAAFRHLWRPALLLLVVAPLPGAMLNQVIYPLQMATASSTAWVLDAIGVGVTRGSDLIFTKTGIFQVIETCSGLGIMTILTASAIVYSELFESSERRTLLLILLAPLLGFAINLLRVLSIIFHPTSATSLAHSLQGMAAIVLGVLTLFGVDTLAGMLSASSRARRAASEGARALVVPRGHVAAAAPRGLLVLGVLVLLVLVSAVVPSWQPSERPSPLPHLPLQLGSWQSSLNSPDHLFLGSVGFTELASRRFTRGDESVEVMIGRDARLDPRYSALSPKIGIPGPGWMIRSSRSSELPWDPGTKARILELARIERGERTLSLYWVEGAQSASVETLRNLLALDRGPWRRHDQVRGVRLTTPIEGDLSGRADAWDRLYEVGALLGPILDETGTRLGRPRTETSNGGTVTAR